MITFIIVQSVILLEMKRLVCKMSEIMNRINEFIPEKQLISLIPQLFIKHHNQVRILVCPVLWLLKLMIFPPTTALQLI